MVGSFQRGLILACKESMASYRIRRQRTRKSGYEWLGGKTRQGAQMGSARSENTVIASQSEQRALWFCAIIAFIQGSPLIR